MHSIELLLDPKADEAVRADWALLTQAGLPSQGRHTGASNAPHVTLLAAARLDDSHDAALGDVLRELPVPAVFSGLVVFGRPPRGLVLARGVVVTDVILRLHRAVHEVVAPADDALAPHVRPGSWTPHVTLASRLSTDELAAAVELVTSAEAESKSKAAPREEATFVAGRRWDSTAREILPLGP